MTHTDDPVDAGFLIRVLGEYREMPGLALTFSQAQRLWGCDGSHVGVSQMCWWSAVCCDGRANVDSCGRTSSVSVR